MTADFKVCLDACVLANQSVCDLLLRLAETPRLFCPVFSNKILDEVRTVHLPYLQPFVDVNKRLSRLAANIPQSAPSVEFPASHS